MITKQQLEISLIANPCRRQRVSRPVRRARAQWWFERMHRAVDAAAEPPPAPRLDQPTLPFVPEREAA